jgi:hypothetical protein
VPRCHTQLASDLAEGQAEPAQSLHRGEAVKAAVALRVCVELVNQSELAIAPGPHFG